MIEKDVLLVLVGALPALLVLWLSQRGESLRLRLQTRETRLSELIDSLETDRQYGRASAIVGIGDLMLTSGSKSGRESSLFRRGATQLSTMLHTDDDAAVQEALFHTFQHLEARVNSFQRGVLRRGVHSACEQGRRWVVGALAGAIGCHGPKRFNEEILPAARRVTEAYYGLQPTLLDELIEQAELSGLPGWFTIQYDLDTPGRAEAMTVRHLRSTLNRYQVCLRVSRLFAGTDCGHLVVPETELVAGIRLVMATQVANNDKLT